MSNNSTVNSPNQRFASANNSLTLEKSLKVIQNGQKLKTNIFWCVINVIFVLILIYDSSFTCPASINYYDYCEYVLITLISLNILYYLWKILMLSIYTEQIPITLEQKKLLGISDSDPNFKIVSNTQTPTITSTPLNITTLSLRSNVSSKADNFNYSLSSPSWTYQRGTTSSNSCNNSYRDTSGIEFISDEKDLEKYLKDYENSLNEESCNQSQQTTNLLSSFWSHPITKTAKDMTTFLKKCQYQLSSQSPTNLSTSVVKGKPEETLSTSPEKFSLTVWSKLNIDIITLTRWNENLRKWISQTILERLSNEFDRINESLDKQGLPDVKIGMVGLDRLRKTAQMTHIQNFVPSLMTLIPFLEVSTNQEYLERRIRELAKGGCMSEFKWNSGSSYNGKEWDESLPTDSAIIMHLFACYMDTQLMPLPSLPDLKPFSGFHYIKYKEKMPILTPNSLYIQQVTEKPPHYRVIVGETVHDMVKGYNNLFYTILFFLYNVYQRELGMLGRVYLGKSGVNLLWIIDQG